ncbi:MAG TPA: hypothetical protein DCQ64_12650 [Candidatus Rokubacteria bacterium]|nr:hypothetical protein [Candidatus Rokubacteria bacterium]
MDQQPHPFPVPRDQPPGRETLHRASRIALARRRATLAHLADEEARQAAVRYLAARAAFIAHLTR